MAMQRVHALTDRQAQALALILRTYLSEGRPPSIRELGDNMGIQSVNGVHDHLKALKRKGYLEHHENTSRGWVPVRDIQGRPLAIVVLTEPERHLLAKVRAEGLDPAKAAARLMEAA